MSKSVKGFTLIEVLVVLVILAIITTVVVLQVNPLELIGRSRDSQRIESLDNVRKAIHLAIANDPNLSLCGTTNPPCYGTSNSTDSQDLDGTGWVKIDLDNKTIMKLSSLPVDPLNNENYHFIYYSDGSSWEVNAVLESDQLKDKMVKDGGDNDSQYEVGSNLLVLNNSLLSSQTNPSASIIPPTGNSIKTINIIVLKYYPLDESGTALNPTITGMSTSLIAIRNLVNSFTTQGIAKLSNGSKYHVYKDPEVRPFFSLNIIENKEFLKAMPRSNNKIPWNPVVYRPDYKKMLTEDINICNLVENSSVNQVWVWGYHHGDIEPAESNMSMGTISKPFWNYSNYGDVSNSERINDLPICNKTYSLFNYNYSRGVSELVEDHTHHIEAIMSFVGNTLWSKFVNPYGQSNVVNHCGWTHSPPNTTGGYDWMNERITKSDCMDWKPEGGGQVSDVSCHTWSGSGSCLDDGGLAFKVWWMQSIPGLNNNLTYQNKALRNWWEFYQDFDAALAKGKSLTN